MLRRIRALLGGGGQRVMYECRHCGSTVEGPGQECPDCGTSEIAHILL